mmetsp:Transcript_27701/g.108648  ORF Transcript_27701/g.108648 Transcript_27701/m.108648 type:complete len:124 (-) Transcript_27701:262-633(-)
MWIGFEPGSMQLACKGFFLCRRRSFCNRDYSTEQAIRGSSSFGGFGAFCVLQGTVWIRGRWVIFELGNERDTRSVSGHPFGMGAILLSVCSAGFETPHIVKAHRACRKEGPLGLRLDLKVLPT